MESIRVLLEKSRKEKGGLTVSVLAAYQKILVPNIFKYKDLGKGYTAERCLTFITKEEVTQDVQRMVSHFALFGGLTMGIETVVHFAGSCVLIAG